MKYLLNLLLVLYSMVSGATEPTVASCTERCNTPFGTLVGQSFLTKAYSNCNSDCVKNENNFILIPSIQQNIFTGMKWQCVEYARRWLIENRGVTFADVEYAYHIWGLRFFETIDKKERVSLSRFKNKKTNVIPQVGDLLIYSKQLAVTGHVAVIVGVEYDAITIAEQNYFNRLWEGKDYARRLMLDKDSHGRYRVIDEAVVGWVRVKKIAS